MTRSIATYGLLLTLLLGLSWMDWTAPPEVDIGDKVMLAQGEVADLERVIWKGEKEEVSIERKSDAAGAYLWVTHTKWEEPKPTPPATPDAATPDAATPDAATPDAATPPAAPATPATPAERTAKITVFKAGEAGDKLEESLSPMLAVRQLTDIPADKLGTYGLDKPTESLELVRKGRSRVMDIGGEVYGSKDRYVRDRETGNIYLVDDELLRPLKFARTRLPDRTLFSLSKEKVASAEVSSGVGKVKIAQKNAEDKDKATWVKASAPDTVDEQLKTWMEKAVALKSTAYVAPEDEPKDLESRFRLTMSGADGASETLEVLQSAASGDWFGRSEHTRGLVKLLKGPTSALAEDVEDLTAQ